MQHYFRARFAPSLSKASAGKLRRQLWQSWRDYCGGGDREREARRATKTMLIVTVHCNLVFYNSCRIGVIVWRDAFKLAHSGRVKAVLLRRSPGSRAICEQHWSSWIHSLLSQLNRTIIGLAADLSHNRPQITEELVWHGRNLSGSISFTDSQTQFHFWNLHHQLSSFNFKCKKRTRTSGNVGVEIVK